MLPVPPDGFLEQRPAQQALLAFVLSGDFDMPVALPKRANPEDAADFVGRMLDGEELDYQEISRLGIVMRFFDLRQHSGAVAAQALRTIEERDDWERAASALMIYCDLMYPQIAAPRLVEFYFELAAHPECLLTRLIDLSFHLPDNVDPTVTTQLLERRMQALEPAVEREEDDALVEYYRLEDLRDDRLVSVLKARSGKTEIAGTTELRRQRQLLTLRYLQLERNPYLDLPAWAALMLQRDSNETSPEQLATSMSENLDIVIARAKKQEPLSEDDQKDAGKYLTRCARAVQFYGGTLTDEQGDYVDRCYNEEQTDLLHWDED
ncbi:MAG: hypothetical protein AAGG11_21300 [Pseudomonadota bacterium]